MEQWISYLRGRALELFGRREAAIAAYRAALAADAGMVDASNRTAYLLTWLQRFDEAEPYFQTVLRARPDNAVAHFNFGFNLDKRGQYERAAQSFREATRLNPKIDRAWYGLGLAHAQLGHHRKAAEALHEAARLQPMNPHAWYQLGMAYHVLQEPEQFRSVVDHLLRFDPKATRQLIRDAGASELEFLVKDFQP
ncbi:MAG: tetratricopeptide repeat protein [Betaproteobacteria bacterium]